MAISGADIDGMTVLARDLRHRAQQVERVREEASSSVMALHEMWSGADTAEFTERWWNEHRQQLERVVVSLKAAAEMVEANRDAQDETSRALVGSSLVSGAVVGGSLVGESAPPETRVGETPRSRQVLDEVSATIEAGDDLAMSEGELDDVQSLLLTLEPAELAHVLDSLSDRQLEVLFHNVHSSGWFSNDWNDRERAEFYQNIMRAGEVAPAELWDRLDRFSPAINPDPALGIPDSASSDPDVRADWDSLVYAPSPTDLWGPQGTESIDYTDIRQGSVGDCYLIAGMITLAKDDPGAITEMITSNPNGTYTVTFPDGSRQVVTDTVVVDGNDTTRFARTNSGTADWPAILEKAYAQQYGGWGDDPGISGGSVATAIENLAGRPGSFVESDDMSFDDLAGRWADGDYIGLSTIDRPDRYSNDEWIARPDTPDVFSRGTGTYDRLHQNHAFVVTDVDEANRTVSVLNPWDPSQKPLVLGFDELDGALNGYYVNEASQ